MSCRFNNAPVSLYAKPPHSIERCEHEERDHQQQACGKQDALRLLAKPGTAPESQSYRLRQHGDRSSSNNQRDEEANQHRERAVTAPSLSIAAGALQQPLAAFFAGKSVHRARRLSISAAHAAQVHANAANSNNGNGGLVNPSAPGANQGTSNPVKPAVVVVKRKLQMESVASRNTTNAILAVPLRGRNNNVRLYDLLCFEDRLARHRLIALLFMWAYIAIGQARRRGQSVALGAAQSRAERREQA